MTIPKLFIAKKKYIIGIVLLILIFIIYSIFQKSKTPQYATDNVVREDIVETVMASGNVQADGEAAVSTTTTGIIEEMNIKNGDSVVLGQTLFRVRSTATEAERASAYTKYLDAINAAKTDEQNKPLFQSQLEAARKSVIDSSNAVNIMNDNRNNGKNNPLTGKAYTQEEIDSYNSALVSARQAFNSVEKKYTNADGEIKSGTAGVNSAYLAYQALKDSTITSPVDGTVINIAYSVGDKVTASTGLGTDATGPVLTVSKLSTLLVKVQFSEIDIPRLKEGQKATIKFDAIKNKEYYGYIERLDKKGTNTQGVVKFNGYISLLNGAQSINPMMTADVSVEVNRKSNVLAVPNLAIKTKNTQSTVQAVGKNGGIEIKKIKLGLKGVTKSEVITGLAEGDEIVSDINALN